MERLDDQESAKKHIYSLNENLLPNQKKQLQDLLKEYEDIIAISFKDLPDQAFFTHHIDTGDAKPIKQAPYRLPANYHDFVRKHVQELLESGVIVRSKSPWASPISIVPKKDGQRMVIDYHKLNSVTKKYAYPIPHSEDLQNMLKKVQIYSTLDLWAGYNQIGMTPEAQEKSAFVTPFGQYEFTRMSFGLCNAPATFQAAMNEIFYDLIGHGVIVYIDDINIYAENFAEHMVTLKEVFERLRKHGLRIKPTKCYFGQKKIEYLGFIIDGGEIRPDPKKTEIVKAFPIPQDKMTLRGFLGLVQFYKRFIPGYSEIAAPLHMLQRKGRAWEWTSAAQTAFNLIKEALTHAPVMARPDLTKVFKLYTDASSFGLGAILAQDDKDGEHVIAYAGRATHGAEPSYGATQLECVAVVWAVQHFRHFLIGKQFTLITDHSALKWLWNKPNLTGMYARWLAILQEYDFTTQYRKGRNHQNVDTLSRLPQFIRDRHPEPKRIYLPNEH